MEAKKFSQQSWHWKLISGVGTLRGSEYLEEGEVFKTDFCTYWKAVAWAIVMVLVAAMAVISAAFLCGIVLGWGAAMIAQSSFIEPNLSTLIALCTIVWVTVVVGGGKLLSYLDDVYRARKRRTQMDFSEYVKNDAPKDSFVKTAWQKIKSRTCVRVEVS